MVVAQVAENNLSLNAKKKVHKLVNGRSLATVSVWADIIKVFPRWSHTKPWHFVELADDQDYSSIEHSHEGNVVTAITELTRVLENPKSALNEKKYALILLVHFVGDIHQPLHIGRPGDRGGNEIKIIFEDKKTNLHHLWDSILISKVPMSHKRYAEFLESYFYLDLPYYSSGFPFDQIIFESIDSRKYIYNFGNNLYEPIKLDTAYFDRNLTLMNIQLLKGGKRLAALLNHIFK